MKRIVMPVLGIIICLTLVLFVPQTAQAQSLSSEFAAHTEVSLDLSADNQSPLPSKAAEAPSPSPSKAAEESSPSPSKATEEPSPLPSKISFSTSDTEKPTNEKTPAAATINSKGIVSVEQDLPPVLTIWNIILTAAVFVMGCVLFLLYSKLKKELNEQKNDLYRQKRLLSEQKEVLNFYVNAVEILQLPKQSRSKQKESADDNLIYDNWTPDKIKKNQAEKDLLYKKPSVGTSSMPDIENQSYDYRHSEGISGPPRGGMHDADLQFIDRAPHNIINEPAWQANQQSFATYSAGNKVPKAEGFIADDRQKSTKADENVVSRNVVRQPDQPVSESGLVFHYNMLFGKTAGRKTMMDELCARFRADKVKVVVDEEALGLGYTTLSQKNAKYFMWALHMPSGNVFILPDPAMGGLNATVVSYCKLDAAYEIGGELSGQLRDYKLMNVPTAEIFEGARYRISTKGQIAL